VVKKGNVVPLQPGVSQRVPGS